MSYCVFTKRTPNWVRFFKFTQARKIVVQIPRMRVDLLAHSTPIGGGGTRAGLPRVGEQVHGVVMLYGPAEA